MDTYICERCSNEFDEDEYNSEYEEKGWGMLCPDCAYMLEADPKLAEEWAKGENN